MNTQNCANNKKANQRESVLLYPELSYLIQGCLFEIRRQYGPGQKEVVYQKLIEEKLKTKEVPVKREQKINIYSNDTGKVLGTYQPDLIVDEKIIIVLK
jgi:GxxExxY protein